MDLTRNLEALYVGKPHISPIQSSLVLIDSRYSIENPLSHLTPDELEKDARKFARTTGLEAYQDLMERGAKIAKDPQYFEVIPGVTDDEKQALRDERRRRFRQPRQLYLTIIMCSIGAAVQYVYHCPHGTR